MKSIVVLMLCFVNLVFAQPPMSQPSNLQVCDDNNDGIGIFDLTQNTLVVLGNLSPSLYNVMYYETQFDAEIGANAIINISSYLNIVPNQQTIYVRVEEIADSSNYAVANFGLVINQMNIINPPNLINYSTPIALTAVFDLTFNEDILAYNGNFGDSGYHEFEYYENFNNGILSNQIYNVNSYTNLSNPQTIYIKVINNLTGCFYVTNFDLLLFDNETINIPDAIFKNALLNNLPSNIDVNNDNEIQLSEASTLKNLNLDANFAGLSSIQGIQYFKNLRGFHITSQISDLVLVNTLTNLTSLSVQSNGSVNIINNQINLSSFPFLRYLNYTGNQLVNLDLSTLTLLVDLIVPLNQLSTLNLLTNSKLKRIDCRFNQISTIDLINNQNLEVLSIGNNMLTNLVLNSNRNVETINCNNNNLNNLILNSNKKLKNLNCSNNQLNTLDLSDNNLLTTLNCNNNSLLILNIKNGYNESSVQFQNNTDLGFICVDVFELSMIQNLLNVYNLSTSCNVNSYCSYTPGGNYNTITGTSRLDNNNNGCDVQDNVYPFMELEVGLNGVSTNQSVYSNHVGQYDLYAQQNGVYTLTPNIENPTYYNVNPNPANVTITSIDGLSTVQNFCVTANGIHNDLEIVIVPVNAAMPGFNATYKILYKNKGNQIMSQNYGINFFYNNNLMTFVSSNQTPDQQTPGAMSWNYSNLMPQEVRTIYVTFAINTPTNATYPVNINDVLTFTANILPQAGDETTQDNLFQYNQIVVGSYDPNDITCIEGEVVSPTLIGSYLHYAVRFENTGTAPTSFIVVNLNVNPNDYDVETFRILETSHNAKIRRNGNSIDIYFENCQLDSGGHGNILFKMKSKNSLQASDDVMSNAKIYFDYNFPIETNDATTIFQTLSNQDFVKDETVKIYPNPAKNFFQVVSGYELKTITIYDAQGRIIQAIKAASYEKTVDITKLSKGIYVLEISSEQGRSIEKLVVE